MARRLGAERIIRKQYKTITMNKEDHCYFDRKKIKSNRVIGIANFEKSRDWSGSGVHQRRDGGIIITGLKQHFHTEI